ncbi:MAG: hypothetical protein PF637_08430 [Spirochaetes bacterium]|jgi:hypothetical protein|nr:hypothetical protein [Spirochaetota bacterium]
MTHKVIGVLITDRVKEAGSVQETLTKHGCIIRTRLGLHQAGNHCSPDGLLLLELAGDINEWDELENDLGVIEGVQVQTMTFDH